MIIFSPRKCLYLSNNKAHSNILLLCCCVFEMNYKHEVCYYQSAG